MLRVYNSDRRVRKVYKVLARTNPSASLVIPVIKNLSLSLSGCRTNDEMPATLSVPINGPNDDHRSAEGRR